MFSFRAFSSSKRFFSQNHTGQKLNVFCSKHRTILLDGVACSVATVATVELTKKIIDRYKNKVNEMGFYIRCEVIATWLGTCFISRVLIEEIHSKEKMKGIAVISLAIYALNKYASYEINKHNKEFE